jgi:hypothetical protein
MNTREQIKLQVERASVAASERLDALRQELAHENDPDRRRALGVRIAGAAAERDRCLQALFETPRTL